MASVTIKLHCKMANVRKDGRVTLYVLLRINRVDRLIPTGKMVLLENWDNDKLIIKKGERNAMKLNALLTSLVHKLNTAVLDLQRDNKPINHDSVLVEAGLAESKVDFIQFCRNELEQMKGVCSQKHFEVSRYHIDKLQEFQQEILFSELTYDFLHRYHTHIVKVKGYKKNTIAGSFRIIRMLLNLAIKKNVTKNYPFKDFKIVSEDVDKDYLPLVQVTQLHDLYDSGEITEKLKGTLGYFLFSCYTGLRFSDASRLRANMIEGNHLIIKTQKTKKQVKIPLSRRAVSLLDTELAGLFTRPLKQSNSRVNTDLGEIMTLSKITKHITYHCSRHSFAINSLILGIDINVISNVLGHTSLKTTQIYAKVVDTYKDVQMDKWNAI